MFNFFRDWRKVLLAIFFLGAFLRFFDLGEPSLNADEFLDMNASYGYFKTGEWQAWDFNFERPDTAENANVARDARAAAYKWQVAQVFRFFAPTEFAARSVSAVWGLVTLLLIFFFTASLTKRKDIGLVAAFLYAVSISALAMDRRLRMYSMFVPVFLAFSWLVFRFLEGKYSGKLSWLKKCSESMSINPVFLFPAAALGLLSLHLHLLTANMAFIAVAYALVSALFVFRSDGSFLKQKKYAVIVSGFILFLFILQFASPNIFRLLSDSFSFPDNHYGYFSIALKDFAHPLIALSFFALGGMFLVKNKEICKEGLWILLSFLAPLFLAVFAWDRNVGEQYLAFAQPFKMMVLAAGAVSAAEFFSRNLSGLSGKIGKNIFAVTLAACLLLLPNYGYFFRDENMYRQTSRSDSPQYRKIFTYFLKHGEGADVLITRDLRSYYLSGAHIPVENIGGEITKDKISLDRLQNIVTKNASGWIILSDNDEDFVSKDAMRFIETRLERVSDPAVRGKVIVYRWGVVKE